MATRQTNKRRNTTKKNTTARRKNSKTKYAGRNYIAVTGLIALLIILITASIFAISYDKEESTEKKQTVIPSKKDNKSSMMAQAVKPPKKDNNKTEEKKKRKSPEYISDLIKLVLYDHEVSRSSVHEKIYKNKSGKNVTAFDITCSKDMKQGIVSSVSSILKENGYKVNIDKYNISAISNDSNFIIKFKESETVVKDKTDKKKDSVAFHDNKTDAGKISDNITEEKKLPSVPKYSKKTVKFAILLDDGGNSLELAQEFAKINYPIAIAVLPHLEHSQVTAQIAKKAGKTVFLHFPMAPKSYPNTDPGPGAVIPSMPEILIDGVVKDNFESLGIKVDGFNNHMGSAITEDVHKISQILKASKDYTNVFIDSRTTPNSVAYSECLKAGFYCGENKLFLDNEDDVYAIVSKIYEAGERARKKGSLIVIGHVRHNTLEALKIALPLLEKNNYKVVPVKSLMKKG